MTEDEGNLNIPEELITQKIYIIRNCKVMLDKDLADLLDVRATRLREQVKTNLEKFPLHFMFQLTDSEVDIMVSQNAIPSRWIVHFVNCEAKHLHATHPERHGKVHVRKFRPGCLHY